MSQGPTSRPAYPVELTVAQSIGYLIAAAGPVLTGAIHGIANTWTAPILTLTALMLPLAACGWIVGGLSDVGALALIGCGAGKTTLVVRLGLNRPTTTRQSTANHFGPGLRPRREAENPDQS